MRKSMASLAKMIDDATAKPEALSLAIFIFFAWCAFGFPTHGSQEWANAGSNISGWVPFIMVFALQSAQARSTRALHLKIDGLIDAIEDARDDLKGAEHLPEEKLDALRGEVCSIE
jgi:low affinity Fe/Cu permease